MATLSAHTCSSCGAVLELDQQNKLLKCKYCGLSFDYSYFEEDDLYNEALSLLLNRNYDAASHIFHFLKTKSPHDPKILRGYLLSVLNRSSVDEFNNGISLSGVKVRVLDECIELSPEEHRNFFSSIRSYIDTNIDKIRLSGQLKSIEYKNEEQERRYRRSNNYHQKHNSMRTGKLYGVLTSPDYPIIIAVAMFCILMLPVILLMTNSVTGITVLLICAAIILFPVIVGVNSKTEYRTPFFSLTERVDYDTQINKLKHELQNVEMKRRVLLNKIREDDEKIREP